MQEGSVLIPKCGVPAWKSSGDSGMRRHSVRKKKPAGVLWPGTTAWCLLTSGVTPAQGHESQDDQKLKTDKHEVTASVNISRDRDYKRGQPLTDSISVSLLHPHDGKGPAFGQGLELRGILEAETDSQSNSSRSSTLLRTHCKPAALPGSSLSPVSLPEQSSCRTSCLGHSSVGHGGGVSSVEAVLRSEAGMRRKK